MTGKVAVPKSDRNDVASHLADDLVSSPVSRVDAGTPVVHLVGNRTKSEASNHLRSYFLANIQPANAASIALVKACGFAREGYSPRYLKIGGRWRDHERWARLAR